MAVDCNREWPRISRRIGVEQQTNKRFRTKLALVCFSRAMAFMLLAASAAHAAPSRDFCADRPGLGTPPCTVEPGHTMIEAGLVDWTLDRSDDTHSDAAQFEEVLIRTGLADHLEVQIGWDGFGRIRERDTASRMVDKASGAGDIRIALRRNLLNPDGSNVSIAAMPYVSLPVGKTPIGAGDWGTGMILPLSFSLPHGLGLAFTPEVDAEVNESGHGRHLAFGSVAGLSIPLGQNLSSSAEISWFRDNDPDGHSSSWLSGLALAWQARRNLQFDAGANFGLNRATPDCEIYLGIARRF